MEEKALNLAKVCALAADEKFAQNIVVLKVTDLTSIADYFVLCSANSSPHLRALVGNIEDHARKDLNIRPLRVDGDGESAWITLDFASVLVHVMTPEVREKYNLESLWSDAPKIEAIRAAIENMPR